ncbi:MAG: thiamine biosynthesis protein ThiJ [Polyangiaceae bacterium]|nr:thiamine biosynthesis protein ThiJ [Polyangiaceae bacterium]
MPRARVLIPLPDHDFDTTEVAVPWRILTRADIEVVFATERGAPAACDPLLLSGVVFGKLGAEPEAKALYEALTKTAAFKYPLAFGSLDVASFDGLLLPGGHAKGMRQYLESRALFDQVRAFWKLRRPVAAICHGVLVLARTVDPETGRSVLFDRKTTCLPKYMERTAWLSTAWKLRDYYRTYPEYVEDEVKRSLAHPEQFERGPIHLFAKGTDVDDRAAFIVTDANYISGRWPGDAYRLGKALADKVLARTVASSEDGTSRASTARR